LELTLVDHQEGMLETYTILKSLILQHNKDKCIKRILDPLFNDAVSNLEKLPDVNIDRILASITVGNLNKRSADYFYLN